MSPVSIVKIPNNKQIIAAALDSCFVYNLEELKVVKSFRCHDKVKCVTCHNSPAVFFTGGKDGFVKIWDIRQKEASFENRIHKSAVKAIDCKQNTIVTGGKEGSVKFSDLRKLVFETISSSESVNDLTLSQDSERVSCIHSNSLIKIYNLNTFETILTSACAKSYIIRDRPEGILVLSGHKISLFTTRGLVFEKNAQWSYPLCISPSNKIISREVGIDVWELKTVQLKPTGIDFDKLV